MMTDKKWCWARLANKPHAISLRCKLCTYVCWIAFSPVDINGPKHSHDWLLSPIYLSSYVEGAGAQQDISILIRTFISTLSSHISENRWNFDSAMRSSGRLFVTTPRPLHTDEIWTPFIISGVKKVHTERRNGFCRLPVIWLPKVTIPICLSQGAIEHKVYMSCVVRFEGTLSRGTYMHVRKAAWCISLGHSLKGFVNTQVLFCTVRDFFHLCIKPAETYNLGRFSYRRVSQYIKKKNGAKSMFKTVFWIWNHTVNIMVLIFILYI